MSGEVGIRTVTPGDIPRIVSLIHATIRGSYQNVYPPRAVEFFLNYHTGESVGRRVAQGLVLVAERDGEIMATGSLIGNEINGLFVRPDLQGKGIGSLILEELEATARRSGLDHLVLSISLPSLDFYAARGYEVLAMRSLDVGRGQALDYGEGRKPLGPGT